MPIPYKIPTVRVMGTEVCALSREATLALALHLMARRIPTVVLTPNAEMLLRAARDARFLSLLGRADLLLADGMGVTAAARLAGKRLVRIPGIDFADDLLCAAPKGCRLFLLGGREGVAPRAGEALLKKHPGLCLVGAQNGYFAEEMEGAVAAAIRAAKPDLLFACLGSPKQEAFLLRHRLPCLALGLGGALDVFSGDKPRAPLPMRRMGLEWLYRGVREPRRLPRLLSLPAFAGRAALAAVKERRFSAD